MTEKWYYQGGNADDVAVSSRARLARNLSGHVFTSFLKPAEREALKREILTAVQELFPEFMVLSPQEMSPAARQELLEKHLVSAEFISEPFAGKSLCLSPDESISLMIGEEDHIRIQVLGAGFQPIEMLDRAREIDEALATRLTFATDETLGYLTHCPTNVGTGLRSSVMLCLPGLRARGELRPLFHAISKLGLTVRGLYGEGSESEGDLFQLSNQVTLGASESEIAGVVKNVAEQLAERERIARAQLVKEDEDRVRDIVCRACGTLERAVLLGYSELLALLSTLRFGLSEKLISGPTFEALNALLLTCGRGALAGSGAGARERDKKRAELVKRLKFEYN